MAHHLQEAPASIRVKLAAVWASLTLCFLYCDYFELYQPGKLQAMLAGQFGPRGAVSQTTLLGVSVLLSVPALMVVFSVVLPANACRLINIAAAVFYLFIMLVFLVLPGVWLYYKYFALIEVALACAAVRWAWTWPRAAAAGAT